MEKFILFLGEQWMLVSVLLVLIFLYIQNESRRGGATISVHQMTSLINSEDAVVLDIRDAADYKEGHIVDSLHIPYTKLKERVTELEKHKEQPIVIVDKMGQHSGAAGKQLREAGFNISRLQGGMTEWRGSNLPLVS